MPKKKQPLPPLTQFICVPVKETNIEFGKPQRMLALEMLQRLRADFEDMTIPVIGVSVNADTAAMFSDSFDPEDYEGYESTKLDDISFLVLEIKVVKIMARQRPKLSAINLHC